MQHFGVVSVLGVRAEYQATDARAVAKLRAVGPFLDLRWVDVIVPATPIVPGDKNRCQRPETALHDGVYLINGPLHAVSDVTNRRIRALIRWIGWMLAESLRRIHP